ncbi:two-component system nitrogen regulation sensor histidine kinase GlnL [Sinobacterium caligoides]|uniref:Sensory histidine kinase/phosphatase NtrB n=1 Tax=Sinobacterium caligoides TaxID=933926 RepID=A0A3N2DGU4_9GAMM|nr:nitrogen regulation protein NR(II) [Sinobacterium caligoides]ROR98868.1 two-component system nitrogen regulation sensor histidine kinase GlnL [Sinobacterium caligoides]
MTPSNNLHSQLLDNLTTSIMLLDASLRIAYLNPSAKMLLDIGGQRLIGLDFSLLVHENHDSKLALIDALDSGTAFTKRHATLKLPTDNTITVDYSVTPIEIDHKKCLLLEMQSMDRLLKIAREETLLASQQNSRTLIRGLAHEIKNPLGGLRGAAQLLSRELIEDELQDYTTIIIEEADRLRNLVDRLLGPHRPPQAGMTNVHEVLERIIALIDAETHGAINFQRDYDPSIPALYADKEQLIQAMLNIIRNAMQVLEEQDGGRIELQTRILRQFTIRNVRHRLVCKVNIIDNGPGIPAELAEQIFFPMVTGRAEGTGLGLSISQSIISQHQGLIECTSKPGRTEFSLYIPLEPIR